MNKLLFTIGFLLPIPAYFNDWVAEYIQNLGGVLWTIFSDFGVMFYPVYLAIFFLPLSLLIAILIAKLRPGLGKKTTFLTLLYGFLVSSGMFLLLALFAVSQFNFGF